MRDVQQIVQQVDTRCTEAKGDKGDQCVDHHRKLADEMRHDQRHKNQQVLQPLGEANSTDVVLEASTWRIENAFHFRDLSQVFNESRRDVHRDALGSLAPDRQIRSGVAGVVEALFPIGADQGGSLPVPLEIDLAVAREDIVEQAKVPGHRLCVLRVARGGEDQLASGSPFFSEKLD